ncbi:hypothetical protein GJW-30_1_01115 [Variibacter gotjawalensis]|uniref:DUF2924 domain-containing protein n=1 Tax=Variibacter gotjawalensis TaxID=1333996 RepID=A0A0S3PRR9_9BRAD|nr:DUF2924 domain-containing protein [Variibacter gotjawalensis]NIK48899.1 hypothetical protein [Variibacter gotjawalensis]RZS50755.1 DUF2924 family protein [Variibacter gotjawalensis]BAT58589.1 hypothetical protein GJW-30_1_01115 [Variibacter gotjawalensis]
MTTEGVKARMARAKSARSVSEEGMGAAIAALMNEDRALLLERWRKILRGDPPAHLPTWLFRRVLAYRMQAAVLGDLDRSAVRLLDQIAADHAGRRATGKKLGKKPPPVPSVPRARMNPGTILIREHDRQMHHVTVTTSGFRWNDNEYRSLTEVAFAITGTRWNGPRFFGLRSKSSTSEVER